MLTKRSLALTFYTVGYKSRPFNISTTISRKLQHWRRPECYAHGKPAAVRLCSV